MRPDPIAREHSCLQALRALEATEGVLIGGYAVSAYGPPRFSVDLDIVLPAAIAPPVREVLEHDGFRLEKRWIPRDAPVGFSEKWVLRDVSIDLLIDGVADRRSGT